MAGGGVSISGSYSITSGVQSITSSSTSGAGLDVYTSSNVFTGNAIVARAPTGSSGNLLTLLQSVASTSLLFQVCVFHVVT